MDKIAHKHPKWWTKQHDRAWRLAREALRTEWERLQADPGADAGDVEQQTAQAPPPEHEAGFEDCEAAFRFGFGARERFGTDFLSWNDNLQRRLEQEWQDMGGEDDWDEYLPAIRHAWEFGGRHDDQDGPRLHFERER